MFMEKLISREALAVKIRELQKDGNKVVFTNGVFDLLHAGHVRLLEKAKNHGNILVIGLNSDSSTKKIKGRKRPIIKAKHRVEVLSALFMVDFVVIFPDITPEKTLEMLKPDVHVKGGDWKAENLPETALVESFGGKVVIEDTNCDITTSSIIKKISELPPEVK